MASAEPPGLTPNKPEAPAWYRWAVLMVISLAMFGNYYLYDTIAPVADLLKDQLGYSDTQFGWIANAGYSVGSIVFLLLGGVIVDRFGTRFATLLFGSICAVAGFITVATDDYAVMLAGRILLGVGAEPLIVAITAAIAKWFKGKELAFAMGINLLIARLASVMADWSPVWAPDAYKTWRDPLVIGAFLGLTCVVGAIGYWILEVRGEAKYSLGEAAGSDKLVLADLFKFNRVFWIITALCVAFYSIIFPFRSFAIKYFMEAHTMARDSAGPLNSFLPLSAMVVTPIIGLVVDKYGRRAFLMLMGTVIMAPIFLMMAFAASTPALTLSIPILTVVEGGVGFSSLALTVPLHVLIPVILLGIAFSLIPAIMWPAVAYIVDQKRLGSAYALMFLLQQGGILLVAWMVGTANDVAGASAANPAGYLPMMWMFTLLGVVALGSAYLLWRIETGPNNHGLETTKV